MSKRDVEEYFVKLSVDYSEMRHLIREMEYAVNENKATPEALESIKQSAENIKANYMNLSYIMFLLNKPVNKKKQQGYEKRELKKLSQINDKYRQENILNSNKEDLETIKEYKV